jgi:CheY-like chemotaxis protein
MKQVTLLWVEDNPGDREMIQRTLRRSSFDLNLVVARDGKEAIDFINGSNSVPGLEPDAVILDLEMPRMNGWDLLSVLRARPECKELPLLVFSSSNMASDITEARRRGATDYVMKPLELLQFRETVLDLVRRCALYPSSDSPQTR